MKQSMHFTFKPLYTTVLMLTLSLSPTLAFAFCSGFTRWLDFPVIKVVNNGSEYTGIPDVAYIWKGKFDVTCGFFGRVKSWEAYPHINVEGLGGLSFKPLAASKFFPFGNRPKEVHKTVSRIFPNVYIQDYAIAACNLQAELLRKQGVSDSTIFGMEHKIALLTRLDINFDTTIGDFYYEAHPSTFKEIVCKKWGGPQIPSPGDVGAQTNFQLLNARLVLFPSRYEGECPKEMNLFMKVEGNLKGTFAARIESSVGWKSEKVVLQTTKFEESSGNWVRDIDEILAIPVMLPIPPSSGGGGNHSSVGDLNPLPRDPGVDIPDLGPDWTPSGLIVGGTPGNNVHKASLRLVAKAGNQTVVSEWSDYNYTCEPKVAIEVPSGDLLFPDQPPANNPLPQSAKSEIPLIQSQSTEKKPRYEEGGDVSPP